MEAKLTPQPAQRLAGKVALITGGAHGIGRAYCERFAQEGAHVAVTDLDAEGANLVAKQIVTVGGHALGIGIDVTNPATIERAVGEIVTKFGGIDILVNNAAMFSVVPMSRDGFESLTLSEWDAMMATNVKGPWLMARAAVPEMRKRGGGKIINISSGTAFKGTATQIHYVTSKAAILGFTKNLAREVGKDGICVNAIAPGSTLSEEDPDENTIKMRSSNIPLRAIGRIEVSADLVGTAVYLASSDSDFVTGQTIVVDGGTVMH
jgi:3-oxoacyl-[acyl-carrier protein] reductase